LLVFKLSEIMMSSQSPNLENILKVRELLEYLIEILVLNTEELRVRSSHRHVVVHIENLEDETNLSKVATFVKVDQSMSNIFVVHSHRASVDKVYGVAHNSSLYDGFVLTRVLIR